MKMKKFLVVLAAGSVAAGMLAGCGSSTGTSQTASSTAESGSAAEESAAAGSDNGMENASSGQDAENASSGQDAESTSSGQDAESASSGQDAENTDSGQASGSGSSRSLIVYFDYSENMGDTSGMTPDAITSASLAGGSYDGVTENDLLVMRDEIRKVTGADVFSVQVTEPYDPDYDNMVGVAQEDQNSNKQFTFKEELPDLSGYDTVYMGMPVWWGGLPQPMVCLLDQYDFSGKTIIPFGINLGSGFGNMINQIEEAEPDATVNENGLTENSHTANSEVVTDVDNWLAQL